MKVISNFLSWTFHPLLIASYATALYLFRLPSDFGTSSILLPLIILGMIITGTFLLPALSTIIMVRIGNIGSLKMERQEERNWPLLLTAMIYFACYYALNMRQIPGFIQLFLLGAGASMVAGLLINLRWKLSLHMIGIGGLCGGLSGFFFAGAGSDINLLAVCFLLAGALGTARLFLQAHSPAQILLGFLIGFAAEFGVMQLL